MQEKTTFLIIDDDPDDRRLFQEALHDTNIPFECWTAVNGEDGLRRLRSEENRLPDFIFLDLNMPIMDGKQCLAELKKDPRLKDIPVIIFSTSSAPKDIEDTKQLGSSYYLPKPTDFQKLCDEIVNITEMDFSVHH
jgi:CheY-like chemotaxis protein